MTDTSEAAELPPNQTNGDAPDAAAILLDEEERARMRPADIDADVREMERRKRVELIMNSKMFREELERIIETQLKDGSGTASGLMQQISDMMGMSKHQAGGGNVFKNSNCVVPINDIRGIEAMAYAKGEKILRCKLAAVYRLIDLYGWAQTLTNTLVTARLNQDEEHFLVNPYGMMFHEITASSLLKVAMQGTVIEQGTTNFGLNMAAFSLHAAVHAARPDLKCIINLHVPSVVAVSALKHGVLPLSQESVVIGEVSTHTYLGAGLLDPEEKDKLARNLGPNNKVLLLSNQGALCCGATIEEAFFNARNTVLACESQLKLIPIGLDNLNLLNDEQRKKIYEAAHRAPESSPRPDQPSILEGKVERKWRVGGVEFEALMRMLDNAGFRTGYIYRHPLVKGEPPRPKNDVEVPPAVSSLGYLLEEEELYRQGLWRKLEGGRKGHDRSRWLNSPNVYQKVEILETGTPDPKKITKWVAEASPTHSSSTPVKIESALQFVPKGTNPKEFKQKQQQIKDYRRADKISAGPQSHILEGVTWEEAQKMQDATVTQTGDQVVLMGAASKGIIQRGHQHNAMVYKSPYAKNPFDCVTDEELDEYKKVVEKKSKGEYDTDFSESEGLSSSAPITNSNKRVAAGGDNIRSPTSITSETEEESRDEPQILRIETKTAPRPSQPEVVLSDDRGILRPPQPNLTLLHYQAQQRHLVAPHPNKKPPNCPFHHSNRLVATTTGNCLNNNCQNYHSYRTNSHLGLPKGSYAVPNPQHFHLARHSRVAQPQRPVLVKITKKMTSGAQQSHHHHGNINKHLLNKIGGHRKKQLKSAVSLTIENSRAIALEISLETVKDFVFPFASALNMLGPPHSVAAASTSQSQACQTSYLTAVDKADSYSNTGNFLKRQCHNGDDDDEHSDFEREILNKLQANLMQDLLKSDDSLTEPSLVDLCSDTQISNDLAHFSAQSADGCTWEIDEEIFKIVDQVPDLSSEISCAENSQDKSPTLQDYDENPTMDICISDKCRRNLLDDFSRTPKKFPVPDIPENCDFSSDLATPLRSKNPNFDETFESCYDDWVLPETTDFGDNLAAPLSTENAHIVSAPTQGGSNLAVGNVPKTTDFAHSLATPQSAEWVNFVSAPTQGYSDLSVENLPKTTDFDDSLATPQTIGNSNCTSAQEDNTTKAVENVPKITDFGDSLATLETITQKDSTDKWILRNFSQSDDFFQSLATPPDIEKYDFSRLPRDNESLFLPDYLQNDVINDVVATLQNFEKASQSPQQDGVNDRNFPDNRELSDSVATRQISTEFEQNQEIGDSSATQQIVTEVDVHPASENDDFPRFREISDDLAMLQSVAKVRLVQEKFRLEGVVLDNNNKENVDPNWQFSKQDGGLRSDISEKQDGGALDVDVSTQKILNSDENLTSLDEVRRQDGGAQSDISQKQDGGSLDFDVSSQKIPDSDENSASLDEGEKQGGGNHSDNFQKQDGGPQSDISEKQYGGGFDVDISSQKNPNSNENLTSLGEVKKQDGGAQSDISGRQDGGGFSVDVFPQRIPDSDENLTSLDEVNKQDGGAQSDTSQNQDGGDVSTQEISNSDETLTRRDEPRKQYGGHQSDISQKQDGGGLDVDVSSQKSLDFNENLTSHDLKKQDGAADVDSEISSQYESVCQEKSDSNVKQDSGEESEYHSACCQTENDETKGDTDFNRDLQIVECAKKIDDETSKLGNDELQTIDDEVIRQEMVTCQKPNCYDEIPGNKDELAGKDESSRCLSTCQNAEQQEDQVLVPQQHANLPEISIGYDELPRNDDELFLEHILQMNEVVRETELATLRLQNVRRIRANEIILNEIDYLEDAFKMNDELQEANRKLDEELGPSSSLRYYRIAFGDNAELAEDDIADHNVGESDERINELLGNVTVHHDQSDSSSEEDECEEESDQAMLETKQNPPNDEPSQDLFSGHEDPGLDELLAENSKNFARMSDERPRSDLLDPEILQRPDDETHEENFTPSPKNDELDDEPNTMCHAEENITSRHKIDDELTSDFIPEMGELKTIVTEYQASCGQTNAKNPNPHSHDDDEMMNDETNSQQVAQYDELSKNLTRDDHFDKSKSDEVSLQSEQLAVHHLETKDARENDEIILLSTTTEETRSSLDENTYFSFDDELFDEFMMTQPNLTVDDVDSSSDSDVMYNIFQGVPTQKNEQVSRNLEMSNNDESPLLTISAEDEGFENDTKLSQTSAVKCRKNSDPKVAKLAEIIHRFVEEQCYEVGELMLFPEIANDVSTQKLLAKLLAQYQDLYGNSLTDEEKNELRLNICACVLNSVENDEKFVTSFDSNSEILSDKLFGVSEFLSELADHFFSQLDARAVVAVGSPDFNSFDRRAKSNVNSHSTPTKTTTKDSTSFGCKPNKTVGDSAAAVNKTSHVKFDSWSPGKVARKIAEQVTTFKKDESKKSGNETYWFSISNSPVDSLQKSALPTSRKVVRNVDDIPLPLPVDLQQTRRMTDLDSRQSSDSFDRISSRHLSYSFDRNLSPIQEEARSNLFFDFDSEMVWPAATTSGVEERNSPDSEANVLRKNLLREKLVEVLRSEMAPVEKRNSPEVEPDSELDVERRNSLRAKLVEVLISLRETKVDVHQGNSPNGRFEGETSPDEEVEGQNSPDVKFDGKNSPDRNLEELNSPDDEIEQQNSPDGKFDGKNSPDGNFEEKNSPDEEHIEQRNPPTAELFQAETQDRNLLLAGGDSSQLNDICHFERQTSDNEKITRKTIDHRSSGKILMTQIVTFCRSVANFPPKTNDSVATSTTTTGSHLFSSTVTIVTSDKDGGHETQTNANVQDGRQSLFSSDVTTVTDRGRRRRRRRKQTKNNTKVQDGGGAVDTTEQNGGQTAQSTSEIQDGDRPEQMRTVGSEIQNGGEEEGDWMGEQTVNGDQSDAHISTLSQSSKEDRSVSEGSPKKDKKKKKGIRTPSFLKKKKEKKIREA